MTSSVVFGVIVILWAVVLIPMWLRRHDEAEETRSVDKFTQAMHTLSRREAAANEKKYGLVPTNTRNHEVHVSGASADGRKAPRVRPTQSAATAADRRRRTLAGLLAVTVLTLMLAVFMGGIAFIALNVIVDVGLIAFVVHLRNRAKYNALIRPSSRPVARREMRYEDDYDYEYDEFAAAEDEDEYFEPVPVKVSRPAPVLFDQTALEDEPQVTYQPAAAVAAVGGVFDQDFEDVAPAAAAAPAPKHAIAEFVFDQAADYQPAVAATRYDAHGRDIEVDIPFGEPEPKRAPRRTTAEIGGREWTPAPVPKPIYASKPAAPPRPKRAPMFEPLLPPVETAAELDPADDLEEILDRRWAVND